MKRAPKRLQLPDRGRLLCAADLRGNLRDFLRVVERFESMADADDGHLLLLGNLIHGPYLAESEWPAGLGRYYRDESPALLLKLSLLQEKHPGRVVALLGNHEYAHIGGPRTSKFADDEIEVLEGRLTAESAAFVRRWFSGWPLWATAPAGLLFSHAAPAAPLTSLDELEAIDYAEHAPHAAHSRHGGWDLEAEAVAQRLGQLLWSRSMSPGEARKVLEVAGARLMVYGHAVVAGYETIGREQLVLGTSFGLPDADKRVLLLDLAARYDSVESLRPGAEIVPLY